MGVVVIDVALGVGNLLTYAVKRSAANCLLGNQAEPALDLIQPTRVRRREVHVRARPFGQPRFDFWMLVGRIVVDDQMHLEVRGHCAVNMIQEGDEFLMPMTRLALGDDLASGGIQRGEQRRGAVSDVIMGDTLDLTEPHWQQRLRARQRPTRALLIDTQHQCVGRRAQIQATMSRTFSMKNGSLDSLKLFAR
jgi:hypothetical protein